MKKCRTDEPLSFPNKVFASSQVSPTNNSTPRTLRGPVNLMIHSFIDLNRHFFVQALGDYHPSLSPLLGCNNGKEEPLLVPPGTFDYFLRCFLMEAILDHAAFIEKMD